jgi:hypothetical protein
VRGVGGGAEDAYAVGATGDPVAWASERPGEGDRIRLAPIPIRTRTTISTPIGSQFVALRGPSEGPSTGSRIAAPPSSCP